jgi:hypothetical protein
VQSHPPIVIVADQVHRDKHKPRCDWPAKNKNKAKTCLIESLGMFRHTVCKLLGVEEQVIQDLRQAPRIANQERRNVGIHE